MRPRFSLIHLITAVSVLSLALGIYALIPKGRLIPFEKIQPGMSKKEVINTFGEPDYIVNDMWAYRSKVDVFNPFYISFDEFGLTDSKAWRD